MSIVQVQAKMQEGPVEHSVHAAAERETRRNKLARPQQEINQIKLVGTAVASGHTLRKRHALRQINVATVVVLGHMSSPGHAQQQAKHAMHAVERIILHNTVEYLDTKLMQQGKAQTQWKRVLLQPTMMIWLMCTHAERNRQTFLNVT
jgi:hypothetical protein